MSDVQHAAAQNRRQKIVRQATLPAVDLLRETKSALVLVDVTNRFILGSKVGEPASTARVLQPIERLLATARRNDVPRYFVTVGHAPGSDTGPSLRRLADMGSDVTGRLRAASPSSWASEIPPQIAPRAGEITLTKWRTSAYFETGLATLLRGAGVETVVLAGVASYGCILASYLDACTLGFFPLLCVEAIDGARRRYHDAAMEVMGESSRIGLGDVISVWDKPHDRS